MRFKCPSCPDFNPYFRPLKDQVEKSCFATWTFDFAKKTKINKIPLKILVTSLRFFKNSANPIFFKTRKSGQLTCQVCFCKWLVISAITKSGQVNKLCLIALPLPPAYKSLSRRRNRLFILRFGTFLHDDLQCFTAFIKDDLQK